MENQESRLKRTGFRFPYSVFRNFVELISFLFLNALAFKYVYPFLSIGSIPVPVPILISLKSTYSLMGGALDFVQVLFSKPLFPFVPFGLAFVVGSVVGRLLCGWACPIGFLQDLILKMKGSLSKVSPRRHVPLTRLKLVILLIILFFSVTLAYSLHLDPATKYKDALGPFTRGVFFPIEPETTLFATIPRLAQSGAESGLLDFSNLFSPGYLMVTGVIILGIFFVGAYLVPWFWCRYLYPTGALMGIFMRFSFLGLRRDPSRCTKCGDCVQACPMQIKILDLPWEKFNDPECTLCLECVGACAGGALALKFS